MSKNSKKWSRRYGNKPNSFNKLMHRIESILTILRDFEVGKESQRALITKLSKNVKIDSIQLSECLFSFILFKNAVSFKSPNHGLKHYPSKGMNDCHLKWVQKTLLKAGNESVHF